MNKVFKVIWSEARNAYVVVSEIAKKNHGSKSCSTKKLLTMLIATGVMTCASMAPAMATNPAPDDLNVTIGKGAHVSVWNDYTKQNINGDIAVGPNAHAWNGEYTYDNESKFDRFVAPRIGSKEYLMDFGQGAVGAVKDPTKYLIKKTNYKVVDGSKIAGSIAIGKNTIARTGSVMLGDHSYTGKLGDIEINPANAMTYNDGIYSTTLGAGAYNSGSLAAVTGALSIASGASSKYMETQNTGATIYGSLNSIESATSDNNFSGVASSVLGFANRTQNANAALIWGTGNEVTNSVEDIGINTNWNNVSVAEAQQKAIEAMQSSEYAGGSVLAIGGGNKADYAKYSQLTGVQNKVTGTKNKVAKYDFVNGYQNTVTSASDVTVIGIKNEVTADGNKVIGDNHKVSGKNNVIFGSVDKSTETTVNNAVVLGYNAKVTGEGGVALGAGSVADRANAVSVGSSVKGNKITRQIINVAEGTEDTDAVNVSQLRKATANANKGWKLSTEDGAANQVASEAIVNFSGKKDAGGYQNITVSNEGNNVKIELADELHNVTGVVNGDSRLTLGQGVAGITNGQASVTMLNGSTTINKVVSINSTGKISGVADGEADKDAVNYGQLKDVKAEALKHSTVTKGDNITVTEGLNKDGGKEYNVALQKDITLEGDNGSVGISGSKGTIWASGAVTAGSVTAGNVTMDGANATVSGLSNKTIDYEGFATTGKAATEEQLQVVATEAGKHTQVKAGTNVSVVPSETADGTHVYTVNADGTTVSGDSNVVVTAGEKDAKNVTNYGVKLNKDLQGIESVSNGGARLALYGAAGTAGLINGKGASVVLMNDSTVINNIVGIDKSGKITGVADGKISADSKDAVNGSQLNAVATEAGKHTTLVAGDNVQVKEEKTDTGLKYTVSATDTTYTEGNGIAINDENNAISVKLKAGEGNLVVDQDGLALNKDLQGIESISNNTSKLVLREGWAGMQNGVGASIFMVGGLTTINNKVTVDEQGKISGVADGEISADSTDAVNGSQLNAVATEAGKHTTLVGGDNVQVKEEKTDTGLKYTVSATDTTYTEGNGIAINGENNAISVKLKAGEGNLVVDQDGLALNKDLQGIESISNNTSKLVLKEGWAGMQNGVGASIFMVGGLTTINNKVTVDEQGKISGVAAGVADTDAVNVSQLKAVTTEAGKHTTLSNGKNTTVTSTNKDGQVDYKVNVAGDLKDITSVSNGDSKINLNADSISISNGNKSFAITNSGIGMSYTTADYSAKSIMLGENGTTISGGLNVAGSKITGVAAGEADTDAVNVAQLKKVGEEAKKHSTVTEGANITVTPEQAEDGRMQYNVALNNDIKLAGDNDYTYVNISGSNGSVWASSSVAAGNVIMDGTTATVSGLGNTTTAYDGFANGEGKAATEEQLKEVSKVAENANQGWNLSTNDGKASKVAPGETVDFSGDKNITISNDGTNVKVKLNENIDVNSVQTNALNSKYNLSVGTMAENGIMPFFVNSTGDFYAAHNKFHVDKDGKVTATAGEIGNVVLQNGVYYGHSTLQDGSLLLTDDNGNHSYIDAKGAKLGKVTVAEDGKISGVAAGAITADSTDAVNGSQLHAVATEAGKHSKVVNGSNINVEEFDNDGQKIYKVNLNKDIMLGDLTGKYVNISGTNGTIETTGYIATQDRVYAAKGAKLADIDVTGNKISNGASSIVMDGSNVKVNDKVTIDQNGKISGVAAGAITADSTDAINGSQLHQTNENVAVNRADIDKNKADIAALDNRVTKNEQDIKQNAADIAQNKADIATNKADIATNKADIATNKANIAQNAADIKKVEALAKKHTTVTAGDNITVSEDTNKDGGKEYKVALDKDIKLDSVTTGQTVMNNDGLKVGKDVSVTATAVTAGKTSISDEGVKVGDKTYISDKGLNANGQQITNVADGKENGDAVNYGQLKGVENQVISNSNRINQLGSRVNKVGAGAAALAALHPMDFDPDDKLTFSAGYGNYGGENAAAIGAYYRPDEKVMFSVGGTVGNGENMVNAGVSFSLDRTNHVSNSRTAMAREILDLRAEVTELKAMVAKGGLGSIAEDKMKIFPDVAENHWAYEYVGKLAAAGIIEGYPDGNFSGDRMMSRYEFAAMLYRAMQKGAQLDSKIINEFAPEMGRIRVDRISGEDGDRDKIERVRVNAVKGERDHYGNKIAKAEAKAK